MNITSVEDITYPVTLLGGALGTEKKTSTGNFKFRRQCYMDIIHNIPSSNVVKLIGEL